MQITREYQALLEACAQEGCPLCRMAQETVNRYLDSWKYELFTHVDVRKELRRTQGFCHTHTWQLVGMGANLQLAQAYRDILSDVIERLKNGSEETTSSAGGLLQRLFPTRREPPHCLACIQKELADKRNIDTLRKSLLIEDFSTRFATSSGLCLEHFQLACTLKPTVPGNWLAALRRAQLACLQRLDEQLGELIRKHDYRFKEEERGAEMKAWQRAAAIVAGEACTNNST